MKLMPPKPTLEIIQRAMQKEREKLRDEFAMAALPAMLVKYTHPSDAAGEAYRYADAMLAERIKAK